MDIIMAGNDLILPPEAKWQALDSKYDDNKFNIYLHSLQERVYDGTDARYIAYFRQKYDYEKDWEYLTVLITLTRKDIIYEWDFDEGQQERQWLYILDLEEAFEDRRIINANII